MLTHRAGASSVKTRAPVLNLAPRTAAAGTLNACSISSAGVTTRSAIRSRRWRSRRRSPKTARSWPNALAGSAAIATPVVGNVVVNQHPAASTLKMPFVLPSHRREIAPCEFGATVANARELVWQCRCDNETAGSARLGRDGLWSRHVRDRSGPNGFGGRVFRTEPARRPRDRWVLRRWHRRDEWLCRSPFDVAKTPCRSRGRHPGAMYLVHLQPIHAITGPKEKTGRTSVIENEAIEKANR